MRALVASFVFVVLLALSGEVEAAAISKGNGCAKVHADGLTQLICTFGALPVAGQTVLAEVFYGEYDSPTKSCATGSIVDSQGGSFTLVAESPLQQFVRAAVWSRRLTSSPSGTYSLTLTCPTASWLTMAADAWTGLQANAFDQSGFAVGTTNSIQVQTGGPTAQANELYIAVLADDLSGTSVLTPSAGWTGLFEQETCDAGSGGYQCGNAVYQISQISGETPSHVWTMTPAPGNSSALIVTFKGEDVPGSITRSMSWTDNSNDELRFRIQKRTDQSSPNWVDVATNLPPNTTSYQALIATTETGDCWRIWAENDAGSTLGIPNQFCPATTPPPPPPPPPPPGGSLSISGMTVSIDDDLL